MKTYILQKVQGGLAIGLSVALLSATSALSVDPTSSGASSHREAPLISLDPTADTTDVYAFVSPDKQNTVTLIADWIPFEAPDGGPNYFRFDEGATYRINVDNKGDAQAHVIYEVTFHNATQNSGTFLYNTGAINAISDAAFNEKQYYTITEIVTDTLGMTKTVLFANKLMPPANIGSKSTPNFSALSDSGIYTDVATGVTAFVGQADDPFWVDLTVFDLLTLRSQAAPIGYGIGNRKGLDSLAGFNIHAIALQVPITRLVRGIDPVLGVWATTSRGSVKTVGSLNSTSYSGAEVQVSRLGMPLVNEAVIPLTLKDAFNSIPPSVDVPLATGAIPGLEGAGALLLKSVLTPELQSLLGALYGVPNPGKPRADIFDIFLQGMQLAQPFTITTGGVGGTAVPVVLPPGFKVTRPLILTQGGEMLRVNTSVKGALCAPVPQRLGVLAGDACGFPNGRRLTDDVTNIELLAIGGAAWQPLTGDTSFTFNPALIGVLDTGVHYNDVPYRTSFPYLAYAHQGQIRQYQDPGFSHLFPHVERNFGVMNTANLQ